MDRDPNVKEFNGMPNSASSFQFAHTNYNTCPIPLLFRFVQYNVCSIAKYTHKQMLKLSFIKRELGLHSLKRLEVNLPVSVFLVTF